MRGVGMIESSDEEEDSSEDSDSEYNSNADLHYYNSIMNLKGSAAAVGRVDYGSSLCNRNILRHQLSASLSNRGSKFMVWEGVLSSFGDANITSVTPPMGTHGPRMSTKRFKFWETLPQAILEMVLVRLPLAAMARSRCLSLKCNSVLSSQAECFQLLSPRSRRPSCTVVCDPRWSGVKFYSHDDDRWFNLPSNLPCLLVKSTLNLPKPCSKLRSGAGDVLQHDWTPDWKLADVDGAFFCYYYEGRARLFLAVCNPLLRDSTVWLPCYPWNNADENSIKLLMNQENKAFIVVVVQAHGTAIFDSATMEWRRSTSRPHVKSFFSLRCWFVWKSVIYAQCRRTRGNPCLHILDTASGTWIETKFYNPCKGLTSTMVSSRGQVMVVEVKVRPEKCIYIWKQLDGGPENGSKHHVKSFSARSWRKETIALSDALCVVVVDFRECFFHGNEYVCFYGDQMNQWIKYVFSTQMWHLMPHLEHGVSPRSPWLVWEPSLEIISKKEG